MQAKTLTSSFLSSQFNYYAILSMFRGRKSKLRLENIYKTTLNVVFIEYEKKPLADNDEISIHQ